jgi:hypothetical protein
VGGRIAGLQRLLDPSDGFEHTLALRTAQDRDRGFVRAQRIAPLAEQRTAGLRAAADAEATFVRLAAEILRDRWKGTEIETLGALLGRLA